MRTSEGGGADWLASLAAARWRIHRGGSVSAGGRVCRGGDLYGVFVGHAYTSITHKAKVTLEFAVP